LKERIKTLSEFGGFSTIGFTMVGLGEPREVRAGVVDGSYFDVMGLRPVLGRLLDARDDGPNAAGAAVLTYRFYTTGLKSDPSVLGKTIRLGSRTATIVVCSNRPYPTRPKPNHRQRCDQSPSSFSDDGHWAGPSNDGALRPPCARREPRVGASRLRAVHGAMIRNIRKRIRRKPASVLMRCGCATRLHRGHERCCWCCSRRRRWSSSSLFECRQPDSRAHGPARRRTGDPRGAGCRHRRTTADAAGRKPSVVRRRAALGVLAARPLVAILARYASRFSVRALDLTVDSSLLWVGAGLAVIAAVLLAFVPRLPAADSLVDSVLQAAACGSPAAPPPAACFRGDADRGVLPVVGGRQHAGQDTALAASGTDRLRYAPCCSRLTCP